MHEIADKTPSFRHDIKLYLVLLHPAGLHPVYRRFSRGVGNQDNAGIVSIRAEVGIGGMPSGPDDI